MNLRMELRTNNRYFQLLANDVTWYATVHPSVFMSFRPWTRHTVHVCIMVEQTLRNFSVKFLYALSMSTRTTDQKRAHPILISSDLPNISSMI